MAEYDGDEMGSLDGEEIEGYIDSSDSRLLKLVEDFEEEKTMGSKLSQEIGKKAKSLLFLIDYLREIIIYV